MIFLKFLFAFVITTTSAQHLHTAQPDALVEMVPGSDSKVFGKLALYKEDDGVYIEGVINNLAPGLHGFHVHEKGLLTNKCVDAGGHFNPDGKNHAGPTDFHRHVGDLGNIYADHSGTAKISIFDGHISLHPSTKNFIGSRAFVVHEKADDLGRGGDEESTRTGNAGARVGCGIVVVLGHQSSNRNQVHHPVVQQDTFFTGLPHHDTRRNNIPSISATGHSSSNFHVPSRSGSKVPTKTTGGHHDLGEFNHRTFGSPSNSHYATAGSAPIHGHSDHSINRHLGVDFHGYGSGHIDKISHSHYGLDDHGYHGHDHHDHHGHHAIDHHDLGDYHHHDDGGHYFPATGALKGHHHGGYGGSFQYPAPGLLHHVGHDDYSHYHQSSLFHQPTYSHHGK